MRHVLLIVTGIVIILSSAARAMGETINVAAAISLREVMTDLAAAYEVGDGDHVSLTFGSSGQLAAQISNGALLDIIISAAKKQIEDLSRAGLLDDATTRIVARNELVLIVPAGAADGVKRFEDLANVLIGKIAVGEPKTVPAGQYAMQVLSALGIDKALTPRLVFGSNVRQVLDYVERGEVAAGIVYATDARQAGANVRVVASASPAMHQPIVYPAAALKGSRSHAAALRFLDFVSSEKGQAFLAAHGFVPTNPSAATTTAATAAPTP